MFPDSIPVKVLRRNHECYDAGELRVNNALYEGGKAFDSVKDELLRWREFEKSNLPGGRALRQARLASAEYEPILAGVLDYLSSATLQEPVRITAKTSESAPADFWDSLNDGLNNLVTNLLTRTNIFKRGYVGIRFPAPSGTRSDLAAQKTAGDLSPRLVAIEAPEVTDWEVDEGGELCYARISRRYLRRPDDWSPPTQAVYCWSLMTRDAVANYELAVDLDEDGQEQDIPADAVAAKVSEWRNGTGAVPLVPLDLPVHIIDRLAPIAKSGFNRSASLEWSLDASAYQQGYVETDRDLSQLTVAESTLVKLSIGEKLGYAGPDTAHLTALSSDVERIDRALFKAIQAGSLRVSTTDANTSRLSGIARLREHGSIAVLLASYGGAIHSCLTKVVNLIKKARGEEGLEVVISGADRYDVADMDQDLAQVASFLNLPLPIPETAKKFIAADLTDKFTYHAPWETRAKIAKEMEAAKVDQPEKKDPLPDEGNMQA